MSCTYPITLHRDEGGHICPPKFGATEFFVPCGQCLDCRLTRARNWATRATHEATLWQRSSFITLTYKEVPNDINSLNPIDSRNFIRRLRSKIGKNFKYFLCGEYGETGDRPHYHALIFGYDFGYEAHNRKRAEGSANFQKLAGLKNFQDSRELQVLENTNALRSQELDDIWELGHTSVGELTFDSAIYCAQYAIKKINGALAPDHYKGRHPEFFRQSKNAIGKEYAMKYADEIIQNNGVVSNGNELPIPPYYLKLFEKSGKDLDQLRQQREDFSSQHSFEKSYQRAQTLKSKFGRDFPILEEKRLGYVKKHYYFYGESHKNDLSPDPVPCGAAPTRQAPPEARAAPSSSGDPIPDPIPDRHGDIDSHNKTTQ